MDGQTFFLNGCNSDVTEAALREIFNVPLAEPAELDDEEPFVDTTPSEYYHTGTICTALLALYASPSQ